VNQTLAGAIVSRVAVALVFGAGIALLRDFSLAGWLLFLSVMGSAGVIGGLASWYGARLAERRLARRDAGK
jgi:hypothetical protein